MVRQQLSTNFYLDEFTRSQMATWRGIDNRVELDSILYINLLALCRQLLQPIRNGLGPVHINSGFRSSELNMAIGGSTTSQHCHGLAADIVVSGYTPFQVCEWVVNNNLPYDQLIHEFGSWTHISIAAQGDLNRQQQLTGYKAQGKIVYIQGICHMEHLV